MPFEDASIDLCRLHSQMQIQPDRSAGLTEKTGKMREAFWHFEVMFGFS